jgi:hypothetical protein
MPDANALSNYYKTLTDAAVLNLKREGGFTEQAELVLDEELRRRNLNATDLQRFEAQKERIEFREEPTSFQMVNSWFDVLVHTKWLALGGIPLAQIGPRDSGLISLLSLLALGVSGALSVPLMEGFAYLQSRSLILPNNPSAGFGDFGSFLSFGVSLGLTLAIYFMLIEGQRSLPGVAILVLSCTIAFPISVASTIFSAALLRASLALGSSDFPPRVYFIPGWVGAILVLGGAMIAFVPGFRLGAIGRVLLWSIGAGGLSVLEEIAMTSSTFDHTRLFDTRQMAPLTIWPTGVAFLLGLFLHFERKRSVAGIDRGKRLR